MAQVDQTDLAVFDNDSLNILLEVPGDMSGYTFKGSIKNTRDAAAPDLTAFNVDAAEADLGQVWFRANKGQMGVVFATGTEWYYDLRATITGQPGEETTFAWGQIYRRRNVTA